MQYTDAEPTTHAAAVWTGSCESASHDLRKCISRVRAWVLLIHGRHLQMMSIQDHTALAKATRVVPQYRSEGTREHSDIVRPSVHPCARGGGPQTIPRLGCTDSLGAVYEHSRSELSLSTRRAGLRARAREVIFAYAARHIVHSRRGDLTRTMCRRCPFAWRAVREP